MLMSSNADADVGALSLADQVKSESGLDTQVENVPLDQLFAFDSAEGDVKRDGEDISSDGEHREVKHEDLGGEVAIKEDDEGRAVLTRTSKIKTTKAEPILWNHVESAREEAAAAFQELEGCTYQSGALGAAGLEETMSCDCKPDIGMCDDYRHRSAPLILPDVHGENFACNENSDCINRLTSIECTDDDCNCGARCANQRFQLREYANVDVFQAGQKGYGLRALEDLQADMFVYEYIGEVINERRFRQRQKEYEEQGEKHFYFMMLQKGEYIDATKKGGFGRFINHSCEPNCYVDKWVVGNRLRMGIFTKKVIVRGEELSFDYNVDRYGGEATPCYCGEPTCLGYIGGKTQTEAANRLPQAVVEALGIDDDDDWDDAKPKVNRRRKKGQDDEEYVNELTPRGIQEKDVPKIMASLLQTTERWLLKKLLQRIQNDANENVQSKIVALHGYQTLGSKLEKWREDSEICVLILQILQKWPTLTRNKISSSKIETHVKAFLNDDMISGEVKDLANTLLSTWSSLEMAYRIPRRVKPPKPDPSSVSTEEMHDPGAQTPTTEVPTPFKEIARPTGPRNPTYRQDQPRRRPDFINRHKDANRSFNGITTPQSARFGTSSQPSTPQVHTPVKIDPINHDLQAIIDAATKKQQEQAAALKIQEESQKVEEQARLEAEATKRADRARRHEEHKANKDKRAAEKRQNHKEHGRSKSSHSKSGPDSKTVTHASPSVADQKRFEHMLAKFVPNVVAKYQEKLGREQVKKRAKEIVKILVAKEMKKENRDFGELTDSKKSKIKAYAREFMDKLVARSSSSAAAAVADEPEVSTGGGGDDVDQGSPAQSIEVTKAGSIGVGDTPASLDDMMPDRTSTESDASHENGIKRTNSELGGEEIDSSIPPNKQAKIA